MSTPTAVITHVWRFDSPITYRSGTSPYPWAYAHVPSALVAKDDAGATLSLSKGRLIAHFMGEDYKIYYAKKAKFIGARGIYEVTFSEKAFLTGCFQGSVSYVFGIGDGLQTVFYLKDTDDTVATTQLHLSQRFVNLLASPSAALPDLMTMVWDTNAVHKVFYD